VVSASTLVAVSVAWLFAAGLASCDVVITGEPTANVSVVEACAIVAAGVVWAVVFASLAKAFPGYRLPVERQAMAITEKENKRMKRVHLSNFY
jgi:membrane protein YdbS with pleckstrin-like domain